MELFVADAFTTRRFSGNQAGVALLGEADFPEEGFMRALAGELKHSETAFVRRTGEGSFHIRYFTPAEEVDLCGHATIASFTVLRERRAIGPGTYALHTRSGDLSIQVGADAVWMDMAPPADGRSFSEEEQAELYAAYGLSLADRPEGLEAQAVSTGLLDILLPVRDLAALERAEQNEGEVTRLSERYGVVGVHMFCPSTPDAAAHCRNFAPLYAIPEEAATGTSNGALTYYLYRLGLVEAGAESRFFQGESMGKPSEIRTRLLETPSGPKVLVGGQAVLALRCELLGRRRVKHVVERCGYACVSAPPFCKKAQNLYILLARAHFGGGAHADRLRRRADLLQRGGYYPRPGAPTQATAPPDADDLLGPLLLAGPLPMYGGADCRTPADIQSLPDPRRGGAPGQGIDGHCGHLGPHGLRLPP